RGMVGGGEGARGESQGYFRALDYGLFFQDDYKIFSNLTLNLGLRWDSFEFSHDLLLRTTVFDPSLVPSTNPFLFAQNSFLPGVKGTPGVGASGALTSPTNDNLQP